MTFFFCPFVPHTNLDLSGNRIPRRTNALYVYEDISKRFLWTKFENFRHIFKFVGKSKDMTQVTSSTARYCNVIWLLCISGHSSTNCEAAARAPFLSLSNKERFDSLKSLCRGTMLPLGYSYSCLIKTMIVKVDEENNDGLQMMTAEAILRMYWVTFQATWVWVIQEDSACFLLTHP